jgi:beta-1,2-mannobiose phosphorylase / 1,2-beta-oligomannan phosphorylase
MHAIRSFTARRPAVWPALLCCLLLASLQPAAAGDEFPAEFVQLVASPANPLFEGAGEGRWDAAIRERGWILREGETWKMWYTGYDGTREATKSLGYATSPDGLTWTRHPENPIYDEHWVEDMMVVRQGDIYYMFAEGKNDQAHLLTSPDGLRWTRQGPLDVRLTSGKPIEPGPYGTPTAWHEEETWYLFYERRDLGVWLATSKDTQVWRNVQDEPVLSPGQGKHDQDLIALNQIVKHDGRYYACYHGTSREPKPNLWTSNLAVSTDLVHWKKYPGNPLLPIADNKSSNILVHDGRQFRTYTMHNQVHVHFPRATR